MGYNRVPKKNKEELNRKNTNWLERVFGWNRAGFNLAEKNRMVKFASWSIG